MNTRLLMKHHLLLTALLMLMSFSPAFSQELGFQLQMEYHLDESRFRDGTTVSNGAGSLAPRYTVSFRRLLLPGAKIISDISMTGRNNINEFGRQNSNDLRLSLSAQEPQYSLQASASRRTYNNVYNSGNANYTTSGENLDYSVNALLNPANYPTLSLQFSRSNTSYLRSGRVAEGTNTSWAAGTFYDLGPVRLSYDRNRQKLSGGVLQSSLGNSRVGASFSRNLFPWLSLSADYGQSESFSETEGREPFNWKNRNASAAISAVVTPSLVITGSGSYQKLTQQGGGFEGSDLESRIYSLDVRSEVLPGVALNLGAQNYRERSLLSGTNSGSSYNANMLAKLSQRTSFSAGLNGYRNKTESGAEGSYDTTRLSLQTQITSDTDLGLNIERTRGNTGLPGGQIRSDNAALRFRSSLARSATYGINYRLSRSESDGFAPGSTFQTLDVDFSWLPTRTLGINTRLGSTSTGGYARRRSFSPSADIRWDITSRDTLALQYNIQQTDTFQPSVGFLSQGSRSISGRFTHRFDRTTSLDLNFWMLYNDTGELEWSRAIRGQITKRF